MKKSKKNINIYNQIYHFQYIYNFIQPIDISKKRSCLGRFCHCLDCIVVFDRDTLDEKEFTTVSLKVSLSIYVIDLLFMFLFV